LAAVPIKNNLVALATAVGLLLSVSVRAELVSTAGGLGVYDTVNNVTWTSDGNLFATLANSYSDGPDAFVAAVIAASDGVIHDMPNGFDTVRNSGNYMLSAGDFYSHSYMRWWGAKAWVNYLNATNYAGANTWALPTTIDSNLSAAIPPSQTSSQMAHLFYGELGQVIGSSITVTHNSSYALFANLQSGGYWAGTEYSSNPDVAWQFYTVEGSQGVGPKNNGYSALAVSPGQVGELVPVPGAVWLFGSGLLGLAGLRRKSKQS